MPVGAATLIGRINIDWGGDERGGGDRRRCRSCVFAVLVQTHLVRGLTMGAVK